MIDFFGANLFFIAVLILIVLIAVWNVFLQLQQRKLRNKIMTLLGGKKAKGLEKVIFELIKRLKENEKKVLELKKFDKYLEKMAVFSIHKVGVVRYNPFKEVGGDQSFSIALLDSRNSGFVITSLYGRETNRIYGKPVKKGKSEYQLSEEEIMAIEEAIAC